MPSARTTASATARARCRPALNRRKDRKSGFGVRDSGTRKRSASFLLVSTAFQVVPTSRIPSPEPRTPFFMSATLRTVTLGCKVNQYETEYVRQGLLRAGYRDAAADEQADLCVVNTCTVTVEGDAKSRQTIRQL